MFEIGDKVCYPMHGIGIIEAIEERTVLGDTARYYVLRFLSGRMTAMVPISSAENVGLRPVIATAQCGPVMEYMAQEPCSESDNWNQRYRDNYNKLRGGDIYDVADVIKCLNKRDAARGLSAGERKMLLTARQVFVAELCAATGEDESGFHKLVGEQ